MYNGHTGEYMNTVLSPHMPLNCNSNIPYYLSDNTINSANLLNSDPYELTVSGFNTPDNKSPPSSTEGFKNADEYSNKKASKMFQRPATARYHLETNTPIINPSFRRGHRKKTLSLNPEEREALESLVEDVIIVGLKDAVLDSDESSDESNNEKGTSDALVNDSNSTAEQSKVQANDSALAKVAATNAKELKIDVNNARNFEFAKENYKRPPSNSHFVNPNHEAFKRHNDNTINNTNNFSSNNTSINNNNNNMFEPALNRNNFPSSNNMGMKQRDLYFNNFHRQNKDPNKKYFPNSEKIVPNSNMGINNAPNKNMEGMIPEHNNNMRQSISNMLSINIYPAQLKVAIKHMDSLPPRFLRRLQTGHNRIGGSEPTLESLSELNLNQPRHDTCLNSSSPTSNQVTFSAKTSPVAPSVKLGPLSASETNSACNSVEKDRSKSKQIHLAETKKIIRNLLGDLDQYTDEAINHAGEGGDDEAKKVHNFHHPSNYQQFLQPPITTTSMSTTAFLPADSSALFRMNYNRFNSESQLNSLDLQPSHHHPMRGSASFLSDQTQSRQFDSLDVAQGSSNYLNNQRPTHNYDPSHFNNHLNPPHFSPMLKNTSLKADAPIFVSNQFQAKPEAATTTKSRASDPEITLLPGVLNANLVQQQQRASNNPAKQAPPQPAMNPVYPYKMIPSQFYTQMPPSHPPSSQPHPLYRGYMPLMNYNQPYTPAPYHMQYNAYNTPMQPPPSHHQPPLLYTSEYSHNQHPYQPWMPPVATGDMFPSNEGNQWYGPQGYMPQYMEQPMTGLGEGGDWLNHEGMTSLERGRQRVIQLLRNGALVMVLFVGISQTDKLSELQMGMNGMCVLNLSQSYPTDNLSQARFKEQQEWNHKKVTETLEERKSLVVIDQMSHHHAELNEYVYMAKFRGYEVVVIRGKFEENIFCNNIMYANEAGDGHVTASMNPIGGKEEAMEFPAN